LTPHLGVEITGFSGAALVNQHAADTCMAAVRDYGVVIYRDVSIEDEDLVAFSRMLGEVGTTRTGEHRCPEIQTITLDPSRTDPRLASYRRGNFLWHIDGATEAVPQKGTLLSAREVDDASGDTEFASTYASYDALPEAEKAKIANLKVVHSFAAAQERANPEASDAERAAWARVPTRTHPIVWSRRDGRKSLLLGATAATVVGWEPDEGRALLDRLLAFSTQSQFVLRHRWCHGDLVTWDNTGMLHRALPFDPASRRLLLRTTLVGDEAVA
jgi:alpha-ketoglutarate-dependent taurine dioxygenase